MDDDVTESLKVALGIKLLQQSHAVTPEQLCVLRAETALLYITFTATTNTNL